MNSPDFQKIFESLPSNYLLLDPVPPKFAIVAVTDAYLETTLTARKDIIGVDLFTAFPQNPSDKNADGVANLSASLSRVLQTKKSESMPIQKYDIPISRTEDMGFAERYWLPVNTPILDESGNVIYIAHHVVDVTEHERLIIQHGGSGSEHHTEESEGVSQAERLNNLMIERELRMVDLKKQLADCRKENGV